VLRAGERRALRATPWLAGAGVLAHSGALVALGVMLARCPLATLPEVLSALAWTAILIELFIAWRYRLQVLHAIILPLVLVVLFVSDLLPPGVVPVGGPLKPWLRPLHIFVILLGVAALFITFAASLIYVLVDRALKAKRPARFFMALPSLERCETIGRISLLWPSPPDARDRDRSGREREPHGHFWTWQPRETLAVLSWLTLGAVVVARLGWGGADARRRSSPSSGSGWSS